MSDHPCDADGVNGIMPPLSIASYLLQARNMVMREIKTTSKVNLLPIMGNNAADLDSFVSSVVLAYFYDQRSSHQAKKNVTNRYVPLLNMPAVPASDLWRLRPEFAKAIELATAKANGEAAEEILAHAITIKDILSDTMSMLYDTFASSNSNPDKQKLILVDHNAPAIPGMSEHIIEQRIDVVGCIDHHVDECYVKPDVAPRIVTTGIGSCTSLIVKHLKDEGMWPTETNNTCNIQQLSKLALAPILIDTFNLQGKGDKCSDTDREMVKFLESHLDESTWNRDVFYDSIFEAKSNSLDLLTMQEILGRDYKEWQERFSSSRNLITIGISSSVRSFSWLVSQAGGREQLVDAIAAYSRSTGNPMDIFAILDRTEDNRKEVLMISFSEEADRAVRYFEENAAELELGPWEEDEELVGVVEQRLEKDGGFKPVCRIWWQGDTSKSRKQLAPLLRQAVKST